MLEQYNFEKDIDVPSKQIIIDGCDVSKCTCFDDGECLNPCETVTNCEASKNCRYKQLKRKEQECEKLKLDLIEAKAHGDYLNNLALSETLNLVTEQLDQLEAENEILEKVNKANQEKIKKLNEKLEEEFIAKQYGDEALFFTLMNIKEICNNNDELKGDFNLVDCDKYKLGKHNLAKKILEEIKVVIDE